MVSPVKISSLTDYPGKLQDIGYIPLDDGANAYRFTPKGMADYTVGSALAYAQGIPGAVLRRVSDKLSDFVSVRDFGASPNNTAEGNQAAFQKALDTRRSVYIPSGEYKIAGSLYFTGSGATLYGSGRGSPGGVLLNFVGHTNEDCIVVGNAASANCTTIRDLDISAPDRTGGFAIHSVSAYRPIFKSIRLRNVYSGIGLHETLGAHLGDILMVGVMGDYGVYAYAGATGTDILELIYVTIAGHATIIRSPTGKRCTGLLLDNVGSVMSHGLKILNGTGTGVRAIRSAADATRGGGFFNAAFLGIEYMADAGIVLEAGHRWQFISPYVFGTQNGPGLVIGPECTNVAIYGGDFASNNLGGVDIQGTGVNIQGACIALNGQDYFGVAIQSTAKFVRLSGCQIGRRSNVQGGQGHGVTIAAGATDVAVIGNDFTGNSKDALTNFSTDTDIHFRGNIGLTDNTARTQASGSEDLRFGNQNGDILRLAGPSAIANRLTIAAAPAGSSVSMFAEGTDADIDVQVVPKGAGLLRFGSPTAAAGAEATHVFRVKSSGGLVYQLLARLET